MNLNLTEELISKDNIINQLFPNLPIFIAHILSTLILLLILWKWVYAPFRKALHLRHLAIKEKIDDAANKQSLANQDRAKSNQILKLAKIKAQEIINNAKIEGYNERKKIIDQAKKESLYITNQSNYHLVRAYKKAEADINKEIKLLALEIATKIINVEINQKKHKELINDCIHKFN